jgi:UDP-N-acetylmuramate: L-alanyl-gamma-D-glutamyl-meso-diaminopimelate ligase
LPFIGVINNIQPDHLDIYGSIEEIIKAFRKLPRLIPENGLLIINTDDKNSMHLKNDARSRIETFGQGGSTMAKNIKTGPEGLEFELYYKNKQLGKIKSSLLGKHNVENILSASTVALNIGISFKKLAEALATFRGVKRRLEVIYDKKGVTIIDDFAHNPDKVSASLSAIRSHFPKHKIIAIFEPRTGSSRRKFFQDIYPKSFEPADLVYIAEPYKKSALNKKEAFSSKQLVSDLNKNGVEAHSLANADKIVSAIANRKKDNSPILIVVMTSGEFDGIHQKLTNLFK